MKTSIPMASHSIPLVHLSWFFALYALSTVFNSVDSQPFSSFTSHNVTLPTPDRYMTVAHSHESPWFSDCIFVFHSLNCINCVYCYNLTTNTISPFMTLSNVHPLHAPNPAQQKAIQVNDTIYFITNNGRLIEINLHTKTDSIITTFPAYSSCMATPRVRKFNQRDFGNVFYFSGLSISGTDTIFWMYNKLTKTTTFGSNVTIGPRMNGISCVVNEYTQSGIPTFYLFGGGFDIIERFELSSSISTFTTANWEVLTLTFPLPRLDCGIIAYQNYIYIIGGSELFEIFWELTNDVYYYDVTLDILVKSSFDFVQRIASTAAIVANRRIYTFGGEVFIPEVVNASTDNITISEQGFSANPTNMPTSNPTAIPFPETTISIEEFEVCYSVFSI